MNNKDRDFIKTLKEGLKQHEQDMSKPVVFTQRVYLNSIKNFYEYATEKSVRGKAKQLVKEGLFLSNGVDFELSQLAKSL